MDGDSDQDTLIYTGKLQEVENRMVCNFVDNGSEVTMVDESGEKLDDMSVGMERYDDTLENKEQVELDGTSSEVVADKECTDYILSDRTGTLEFVKNLILTTAGQRLSKLILKAETIVLAGTILAKDLNVLLQGKKIDIKTGSLVSGRNVTIQAEDGDSAIDITGTLNQAVGQTVDIEDAFVGDLSVDLFDYDAKAEVNLAENAEIRATEDVVITAFTTQNRPFVRDQSMNFATVKIGQALISILGTIYAGGDVTIADENETNVAVDPETEAKSDNLGVEDIFNKGVSGSTKKAEKTGTKHSVTFAKPEEDEEAAWVVW